MTSDFIDYVLFHFEKCNLGMRTKDFCATKTECFDSDYSFQEK